MSDNQGYVVGSGNVFADIGLPEPQELLARAELVRAIELIVSDRGWSEAEAAAPINVDPPRFSALLRGDFDGFTTGRLLELLNALDFDVTITVTPRRPRAGVRVLLESHPAPHLVAKGD